MNMKLSLIAGVALTLVLLAFSFHYVKGISGADAYRPAALSAARPDESLTNTKIRFVSA